MDLTFRKSLFNYQILRQMSYIGMGAGAAAPFLFAAEKFKDGDVAGWAKAWSDEGENAEASAETYVDWGDTFAARTAFLSASNYYWLAEFFQPLRNRTDEGRRLFERLQSTYRRALEYWPTPVEAVSVPYEGVSLGSYFFKPDESSAPRPTIIAMGGFDSTVEVEVCSMFSRDAVERGYNFLAFEGPGQGAALRLQGLSNRFDYEVPIGAAVDYLMTRSDVDPNNIILMGSSFGGYYSARAAAFEHRLKALVVHSALFSVRDGLPAPILASKTIAKIGTWFLLKNADFKLMADKIHAVYGMDDLVEVLDHYKKFDLKDVASKIQCPTYIIHGADDDLVSVKQAHKLYDHLKCEKELHVAEGAAALHCQIGHFDYAAARIFHWLDGVLKQ